MTIGPTEIMIIATYGALYILPFLPLWKIISKAGFPEWLRLGTLVPILNVIILFYVAFEDWPIYRELKELKSD